MTRLARMAGILGAVGWLFAATFEEVFDRSVREARAGNFPAARAAATECLSLRPQDRKAKTLLTEIESQWGLSLAAHGDYAEAAKKFQTVIALVPDFAGAHYNLGLCLMNLGDAAAAESAFQAVLRLSPSNAKARIQLAYSLLSQARSRQSRMKEAADALRTAISVEPDDADLRYNLAFALGRMADDDGALVQYIEVLRLRSDYPQAEASLGYTYFRLSKWTEAVTHFRIAAGQGQSDFALHYYLGSALLKLEETNAAGAELRKAALLDPGHPGVRFQLAAYHRQRGEPDRAVDENRIFRELSEKQETRRRAEGLETAAKGAIERGDLAEGINALTLSFQNSPEASIARNLALAYLQKGEAPEARKMLERALDLAPRDASTYNLLGLLEARAGRRDAARKYFERAISLDATLVEASYNAGLAALDTNDVDAAIRHFEFTLQISDSARVREGLALALTAAGRHQEAREHFDAAQKLR